MISTLKDSNGGDSYKESWAFVLTYIGLILSIINVTLPMETINRKVMKTPEKGPVLMSFDEARQEYFLTVSKISKVV